MTGFDLIAPFYDRLASLVFGRTIRDSQTEFLQALPPRGTVLLIGGGTGWLLQRLLEVRPEIEVWYVEKSARMLELSREKLPSKSQPNVRFIHGTETDIPEAPLFDGIITPFFLDLFDGERLQEVWSRLYKSLKPEGYWLVADFRIPEGSFRFAARVLVSVMYLFFRICCGIQGRKLPHVEDLFDTGSFRLASRKLFANEMIGAFLFLKIQ
jgi:ubiquinone/menaquinone biosynthesis C-methylase UbiE